MMRSFWRRPRGLLLLVSGLVVGTPLQSVGDEPEATRIHLSAEVEESVPNDEAVVVLRYQAEGKDLADLRKRVNSISVDIGKRLEDEEGLEIETLGRTVQEVRDHERNVRIGWRLVQRTEVVSTRLDDVARWLDDVEQRGAQVERLEFRVRAETLRTMREDLRGRAIEAFLRKGEAVAASLGAETFRVGELHTGEESDPRPFRMQSSRALATAEAAPEPEFERGEGQVSVTVRGQILVPFREFSVK